MRKLLLLWLICLPAMSQVVIVNCASSTLGQTYTNSTPSLQAAFTQIQPSYTGTLAIFNPSAAGICVTPTISTSPPAAYNSLEHCTAGTSVGFWQKINQPTNGPMNLYIRADQNNCTSTVVYIDYW